MFKFNELEEVHLEITNNCQASCPMCQRNRNGGLENPLIRLTDWTLADYKNIMSPQVLNQITGFLFCGNFGDPILNKDLLDMCSYSTQINPNLNIRIHTNGSARTVEWWGELAQVLPKTHNLIFALDGLEDTHSLYRIGTDFNKILKNAQAFIEAGGTAEWCFIRFKHNQDQVEEARKLSKELGFQNFVMKNSSRFLLEPKVDALDKNGQVTHTLEPATDTPLKFIDKRIIDSYKQILNESIIDCQSFSRRQIYIDAFKNVFPCCWIANTPYAYIDNNDASAIRYKILDEYNNLIDYFGGIDKLNATKQSVKSIVDSTAYQTVWNKFWEEKILMTCARQCGRSPNFEFAKSRDQIVNE
jgi:MoaA/NifB/PqqE/SkfB family radical SAM enzyme